MSVVEENYISDAKVKSIEDLVAEQTMTFERYHKEIQDLLEQVDLLKTEVNILTKYIRSREYQEREA